MIDTENREKVAEHLDEALDRILAVRVALSLDVDQEPPVEALDAAMAADEGVQEARRAVLESLEVLTALQGPQKRQGAFYDAESAVNALIARVLELGWRVGALQGRRT